MNNHKFLWERMDKDLLNNSKFFEKQEIRWFCENDMKKKKNEFRPFYREILDMFLKEFIQITKFIKNKASKHNKKSSKSKTFKLKGG